MSRSTRARLRAIAVGFAAAAVLAACSRWDPKRPFDRDSPAVNKALEAYDAGDARSAHEQLAAYLETGICKDGVIATPPRLGERREATFDMGLALMAIAETFGGRFEDTGQPGQTPRDKLPGAYQEAMSCATLALRAILESKDAPAALRARAHTLQGNLHFYAESYAEAVKSYEQALAIVPGVADGGDSIGRDAAWNRAVALKRLEDKKDAGSGGPGDGGGGTPEGGDQGKDASQDSGKGDSGSDSGSQNDKDKEAGAGDSGSAGQDGGDPDDKDEETDGGGGGASPEHAKSASPDDRVLESLELAPLLQHELSRRAAQNRKVRGSADK